MAKVSVLVAVYNAADYLPACLDSLKRQSLADLQVICVDDASTDGSLAVLQSYQQDDSRIEVVHLDENRGQAHARNVALRQASGEYICFVDSDDWLSDDALEKAVATFDTHPLTDCVLFRLVYCEQDSTLMFRDYPQPPFEVLTGREAFRKSLDWTVHGVYMVRGDLHRQFPYDETCRAYSDDNTTRIHYYYSREVRSCQGTYFYRINALSVTLKASVRRFDYLRANESMRRQLLGLGVGQELLDEYENCRWLNLVDVYMFYHVHGRELTPEERRYGLSELHRAWAGIDRRAIEEGTTAKFGYRPCKSWGLFRVQEWLYFTLRGLIGRNR